LNADIKNNNEELVVHFGQMVPFDGVLLNEEVYKYYVKKERNFDLLQEQLDSCRSLQSLNCEICTGIPIETAVGVSIGAIVIGILTGALLVK